MSLKDPIFSLMKGKEYYIYTPNFTHSLFNTIIENTIVLPQISNKSDNLHRVIKATSFSYIESNQYKFPGTNQFLGRLIITTLSKQNFVTSIIEDRGGYKNIGLKTIPVDSIKDLDKTWCLLTSHGKILFYDITQKKATRLIYNDSAVDISNLNFFPISLSDDIDEGKGMWNIVEIQHPLNKQIISMWDKTYANTYPVNPVVAANMFNDQPGGASGTPRDCEGDARFVIDSQNNRLCVRCDRTHSCGTESFPSCDPGTTDLQFIDPPRQYANKETNNLKTNESTVSVSTPQLLGCSPGIETHWTYCTISQDPSNKEACAMADPSVIVDGKLNLCKCKYSYPQYQVSDRWAYPGHNADKGIWAPWSDTNSNQSIIKFCSQHDTVTDNPMITIDPRCTSWCSQNPQPCNEMKNKYCLDNPFSPFCGQYCADPNNNCYTNLQTFCNDENLTSPSCIAFCESREINCDAQIQKYCNKLTYEQKISPEYNQLCGCFMGSDFYDKFFKSFNQQIFIESGLPVLPQCYYPYCSSSEMKSYNVKTSQTPCPDVQNCIQNIDINNDGTIDGDININQSGNCNFVRKKISSCNEIKQFIKDNNCVNCPENSVSNKKQDKCLDYSTCKEERQYMNRNTEKCDVCPSDKLMPNKYTCIENCDSNSIFVDNVCTPCGEYQKPNKDKTKCEDLVCLNNCSGNGICKYGKCVCNDGYEGDDCSNKKEIPTPEPPSSNIFYIVGGVILIIVLVILFFVFIRKKKNDNNV